MAWTFNDIEEDIKKIKEIVDNENDLYKKVQYKFLYDKLLEEFSIYRYNISGVRLTTQELLNEQYRIYSANGRYYELIEILNSFMTKNKLLCESILSNFLLATIDEKEISNGECISLVNDFYTSTDDKFSKLYINMAKSTSINFVKKNHMLESSNFDGFCLYVGVLNKHYILVRDEVGIRKVINLSHELGHGIASEYNPMYVYKFLDEFSIEYPSMFFELAFSQTVTHNINPLETALFNMEKYEFYKELVGAFLKHKLLIDEWISNGYNMDNNYYRKVKDKYGLNRSDVRYILSLQITDEGKYITGYMMALNLLNIYKQDKKEALILLRMLLNSTSVDTYMSSIPLFGDFKRVEVELTNILKQTEEDSKKRLLL